MTMHNPASGNAPGLPRGQAIPQGVVEKMMLDAHTLHGLIEALDLCLGDCDPAPNALITVARPIAKQLATDLAKQW